MYLGTDTLLHNRYVIESLLGHGGFGITYAAHDQTLNVRVAIKEYLPRQLATRGEGRTHVSVFTGEARQQYDYGLRKFLEEAQSVARFAHHPNVVSARDYFAANGTAYMVMEYVEGVTLKQYLEKKGGRLAFEEAKGIMMPVMDALREVHQAGMLHRDISPDNIYITTSAQVKILDFGAARYFAGEQSKSLSIILKAGYAPVEQYSSKGKQGPWTDIYATAATIYKAVTGETPPDALDRLTEDTLAPPSRLGVAIPPAAEQALLKALAVNAGQRFHAMGELQQALLGNAAVTMGFQPAPALFQPAPEASYAPVSAPVSAPPQPPVYPPPSAPPSHYPQAPRRSANPAAIAAGIGAGVLGLVLLVVLIWRLVGGPSPISVVKPPAGGGQGPVIHPPEPPPVKTRFTKAKDGVISDSATGLEWYVGSDRDTDWNQAKSLTENLNAAGGGWRLPTIPELKTLYQPGTGRNNMDPLFQTTGLWVWSGQLRDAKSAWYFGFNDGQENWCPLDAPRNVRAFAVRSRQRSEVRRKKEGEVQNPDTPTSVPPVVQPPVTPQPSSSTAPAPTGASREQQLALSQALFEQGRTYFKENKFTEAIEKLQASIQLDPSRAMAHYLLGWSFNRVDRSPEALEQFKRAIVLKSDYALAHDGLAWTYNKLNRFSEAIVAGEQAVRLNYQFPDAQYNLGMAYLGLGNRELAVRQYNILQKMNRDKAAMLLASLQKSDAGQSGSNLSQEDLRGIIEQLSERIRTAHLNKDINKWLSCYHSSYPNLGRVEKQMLELWNNYDIKEVSYRISNVQRVNDKQATADIVWNIQLYDHRTHDYTLVRQKYQTILENGPGGLKIRDSKEIAGG